jgi:predicted O-methyltransferase YrrM
MQNVSPANDPHVDVADIIAAVPTSASFHQKCARFAAAESKSLLAAESLAFMHELIGVLEARSILEIGTYFAGGTKVLADAAQGTGMVLTIDSNGARAPYVEAEIATWPQPMRDATMFLPFSAADLFSTFSQRKEFWFDLCLVDGDHRHTAALADLLNTARYAGPGAVILVDDATQPAVFNAVRDFLTLRPNWREIGGALEGHNGGDAFATMRPSLDGLPFLILVGADHPEIGQDFYDVGASVAGPVRGLDIDLAVPAAAGTLQGRFALSYVTDQRPEMRQVDVRVAVPAGARRIQLALEEPLSAGAAQGASVAATLHWHGTGGPSTLALARSPRFQTG